MINIILFNFYIIILYSIIIILLICINHCFVKYLNFLKYFSHFSFTFISKVTLISFIQ